MWSIENKIGYSRLILPDYSICPFCKVKRKYIDDGFICGFKIRHSLVVADRVIGTCKFAQLVKLDMGN